MEIESKNQKGNKCVKKERIVKGKNWLNMAVWEIKAKDGKIKYRKKAVRERIVSIIENAKIFREDLG